MVELTRLNGSILVVNAEMIETLEATPDTVVTLVNGKKMIVKESTDEVIERIVTYKRRTLANLIYHNEEADS